MASVDKKAIKTEHQFILTFLQQSVGLYVKSKNNEHTGVSSNQEMLSDTKSDLSNLLEGLARDASGHIDQNIIKNMTQAIKGNLDVYVATLDQELSESRNQILVSKGLYDANALQADRALKEAGESLGNKIKGIESQDLQTAFSAIRDLCKSYKLELVAEIFDWMHQREQAKQMINSVRIDDASRDVLQAKQPTKQPSALKKETLSR